MLENLNMIREKGLDLFVRRQNELYRCEVCGKLKTVHQKYCLFCGNENKKIKDDHLKILILVCKTASISI